MWSGGTRVVVATVLVVMMVTAQAFPTAQDDGERGLAAFRRSLYGSGSQRHTQNQCTNNPKRQHMCEMCAKETKSQQVYTLCCSGADNAQSWCQSFLLFGISSI